MKLLQIISLLFAVLVFAGCASTESATDAEETETMTQTGEPADTGVKTAYDGQTGSGLLMERYKSGSIEGYRN